MKDERSKMEELEGRMIVTDSRSRIAIYGGKDVVLAMSEFVSRGTETLTTQGMAAFLVLCVAMRAEAGRDRVSPEVVSDLLFS